MTALIVPIVPVVWSNSVSETRNRVGSTWFDNPALPVSFLSRSTIYFGRRRSDFVTGHYKSYLGGRDTPLREPCPFRPLFDLRSRGSRGSFYFVFFGVDYRMNTITSKTVCDSLLLYLNNRTESVSLARLVR